MQFSHHRLLRLARCRANPVFACLLFVMPPENLATKAAEHEHEDEIKAGGFDDRCLGEFD